MDLLVVRGIDLLAVAAAALSTLMAAAYAAIMESQGSDPLWWVLAALGAGAVLSLLGAPARVPWRTPALIAAAGLLGILGFLAILSIGFPIVIAGGLALLSALRPFLAPRLPGDAPANDHFR